MPVIGFLNAAAAHDYARPLAAFLKGLSESGYDDGRNVAIEYRWADDHNDRLAAMAADLVRRKVAVIAAAGTPASLAAKATSGTIPIVFETGGDPIQLGLVTSLNRPGGNVTGVTQLVQETGPKLLELVHELLPTAHAMAVLVNPADAVLSEATTSSMQAAAHNLGLELYILNATSERDFDGVFKKLVELKASALVIGGAGLFTSHSEELARLALRNNVPAAYKGREFASAGGLISYGSDITDSYHLAGAYTGRVLKGDKPADLPVQRATKIELIINLKSAKALGINVPLPLSGRADEIIE
jgi:putative ABC transport system substrate-binding protein